MKIFTKMKHMMLMAAMCWASTALAVNVKGSYAVVAGDVKSGNAITSVDGITMTYGTDDTWTTSSASVTVDSKTFTVYASGSTNPTPSSGNIPTAGIYVVFEPEHDGTITAVVQNAGNTKSAYIVEGSDGNLVDGTVLIEGVETSWTSGTPLNSAAAYSGGVTFEVKGGSKYYFYIAGSKMRFMGFIYTYDGYGAELLHTASSYNNHGTSTTYYNLVDAAEEWINQSAKNYYEGHAYAEFSFSIPDGHSITRASLKWTGISKNNRNRDTDVMVVNAGLSLDYETMPTSSSKISLDATTIETVSFPANKTVTFETDVTEALKTIASSQTYIIFKFTNNAGGGRLVGKGATENFPELTIETAEASAMTTYTVKYVDGAGNEIKEASVYEILAGDAASITDENKVAIYANDKKYVYESCDKESFTAVADGASNIITATFREAATWNYTANAVDGEGNVLKVLATGSNFQDETVSVYYSKYILKDGVLYEKAANNNEYKYTFTLSSNNMNADVSYGKSSITNAYYCDEAENIEGLTVHEDGYTNIRMSNGVAAYATALSTIISLPAGVYTLTSATRAGSTKFYAGSREVLAMSSTGSVETRTSEEFTLYEPTEIKVSAGDKSNYFDYVLICCVGEAPDGKLSLTEGDDFAPEYDAYTSATYTRAIEAGKYGTICLPFAPDAASLENYTFFTMESAEGNTINFVEEEAPVANTPYIYCLKAGKEATAITGGVTVVSATLNDVVAGDWTMKGSFTNQAVDAAAGNYYGYVAAQNKIVKAKETLTVKPYRAYFTSATGESAVALRITRGDETTEITTADLDVQPATVIYDLAGRRVEKMEKGIYIVNGKKVIR